MSAHQRCHSIPSSKAVSDEGPEHTPLAKSRRLQDSVCETSKCAASALALVRSCPAALLCLALPPFRDTSLVLLLMISFMTEASSPCVLVRHSREHSATRHFSGGSNTPKTDRGPNARPSSREERPPIPANTPSAYSAPFRDGEDGKNQRNPSSATVPIVPRPRPFALSLRVWVSARTWRPPSLSRRQHAFRLVPSSSAGFWNGI